MSYITYRPYLETPSNIQQIIETEKIFWNEELQSLSEGEADLYKDELNIIFNNYIDFLIESNEYQTFNISVLNMSSVLFGALNIFLNKISPTIKNRIINLYRRFWNIINKIIQWISNKISSLFQIIPNLDSINITIGLSPNITLKFKR